MLNNKFYNMTEKYNISIRNIVNVTYSKTKKHIYIQATIEKKVIASFSSLKFIKLYGKISRSTLLEIIGKAMAHSLIVRGLYQASLKKNNLKFHGNIKILLYSIKKHGINI